MSRTAGRVDFSAVQSLVLRPAPGPCVAHRVLRFETREGGRQFLQRLTQDGQPRFGADKSKGRDTAPEMAIGFTFRGLEALNVPDPYLHVFRHYAPAFAQGAPLRASSKLGDCGANAPHFWEDAFALDNAHAILTLHGESNALRNQLADLDRLLRATFGGTVCEGCLCGARIERGPASPGHGKPQFVHFGYRDGLTRSVVVGDGTGDDRHDLHEPGELVLGEIRDLGDNPWSLVHLPKEVRTFFRHGSFGVLRKIQQFEKAFEKEVDRWAWALVDELALPLRRGEARGAPPSANDRSTLTFGDARAFVRAKLCGRWPDGRLVRPWDQPGARPSGPPEHQADFTYDARGHGCPFGAHIRRMNPRNASGDAEGGFERVRPRPLFRRGMPYGPEYDAKLEEQAELDRGLLGLFFCADIQDQFEHLLGEWADRLPLGAPGDASAKDPFIGAHAGSTTRFEMPRFAPESDPPGGSSRAAGVQGTTREGPPLAFWGFQPFVRTLGTAYAFYPSKHALAQLIEAGSKWEKETTPWLTR